MFKLYFVSIWTEDPEGKYHLDCYNIKAPDATYAKSQGWIRTLDKYDAKYKFIDWNAKLI